jgi:glutathione S-transferase
LPADLGERVEVRRVCGWFNDKFFAEVTDYLVQEKVVRRHLPVAEGGGPPDSVAIRAARANIRYHLQYIGWLLQTKNWLAGDRLSYADLAAAAHLSTADYLGDVPWSESESAKNWYARMKSRPAFRPLLSERLPGMAPAASYADLDF